MEGIDLFVKILSQGRRKEGQEFRSLEVRGEPIALKKGPITERGSNVSKYIAKMSK